MIIKAEWLGDRAYPPLLGDREYKDGGRTLWVIVRVKQVKPKKNVELAPPRYRCWGVVGKSS